MPVTLTPSKAIQALTDAEFNFLHRSIRDAYDHDDTPFAQAQAACLSTFLADPKAYFERTDRILPDGTPPLTLSSFSPNHQTRGAKKMSGGEVIYMGFRYYWSDPAVGDDYGRWTRGAKVD